MIPVLGLLAHTTRDTSVAYRQGPRCLCSPTRVESAPHKCTFVCDTALPREHTCVAHGPACYTNADTPLTLLWRITGLGPALYPDWLNRQSWMFFILNISKYPTHQRNTVLTVLCCCWWFYIRSKDFERLSKLQFWADIAEFKTTEKRLGLSNQPFRMSEAWDIYHKYFFTDPLVNIGT